MNNAAAFIRAAIKSNTATTAGGGVYTSEGSTISFTGCELSSNSSAGDGGGIYLGGAAATLYDSPITENTAARGGGGAVTGAGELTFTDGDIKENHATAVGGAIYLIGDGAAHLIATATIEGNTAQGYAPGIYDDGFLGLSGAIYVPDGVYLLDEDHLIRIEGSVSGGLIKIVESPYVAPDAGRAHIDVAEATDGYPQLTLEDALAFRKPAADFENWFVERSEGDTRVRLNTSAGVVYNIYYVNLMGASSPNPATYSANSLPVVLMNPGELPNYRFVGWFDSMSGGNQVTEIPVGATGDITIYARWEYVAPPTPPCPPHPYCLRTCCCTKCFRRRRGC